MSAWGGKVRDSFTKVFQKLGESNFLGKRQQHGLLTMVLNVAKEYVH
jgi:hypothetical protein